MLDWAHHYRVIPSQYPTIELFERLVATDLMDELFYIESLTNDRLRDAVGDIRLIAPEDRISGPGATPVMAAFTHVGNASRFSDGSYGLYYAAKTQNTAIAESRHRRTQFLARTREAPGEISLRVYIGEVCKPLHDIREPDYAHLHQPDDWTPAQAFAGTLRATASWGLVYRSVRDPGGECLAAFRPPAVSIPRQGPHLSYVWDGTTITRVFKKTQLI